MISMHLTYHLFSFEKKEIQALLSNTKTTSLEIFIFTLIITISHIFIDLLQIQQDYFIFLLPSISNYTVFKSLSSLTLN